MALTPERIEKRLKKVFLSVFPNLGNEEIVTASTESIPTWDSLATLTLFTTVESEFAVTLGLDQIQNIKSFDDVRMLITQVVSRNPTY